MEVIRDVTKHGKISYRCIQSTRNVFIRDSVDENLHKGCELEGCPHQSSTDPLDESDDEMESQPPLSNSDAQDLAHQHEIKRGFHDFKNFVWGGGTGVCKEA